MKDATCGTIAQVHCVDAVFYVSDSADANGVLRTYLSPVETTTDIATRLWCAASP